MDAAVDGYETIIEAVDDPVRTLIFFYTVRNFVCKVVDSPNKIALTAPANSLSNTNSENTCRRKLIL